MKTEHVLLGLVAIMVVFAGWQTYSTMSITKKIGAPAQTITATVQPVAQPQIKLPSNIQSSAPIQFKSVEEEIAYYKKNAKNPNNIDIEQAIRNMDANLDGQCDTCGMAILHCIESGMEDM